MGRRFCLVGSEAQPGLACLKPLVGESQRVLVGELW